MTWDERCAEFLDGLDKPGFDAADRLTLWLEGFRLALPPDEPAYRLLFRMAVANQKTGRLAEIAAIVLDRWVEGTWSPVVEFQKAAYNLLHLVTELRDPSRLANPIWRLYEQRIPQGEYISIRLSDVLLEAMIVNQRRQWHIFDFWDRLLSGQPDDYLGGSVEQATRGLAVWTKPKEIRKVIPVYLGRTLGQADPEDFIDCVSNIHPSVARWSELDPEYRKLIVQFRDFSHSISERVLVCAREYRPSQPRILHMRRVLGYIVERSLEEVQDRSHPVTQVQIGGLFRRYLFQSARSQQFCYQRDDFEGQVFKNCVALHNRWAKEDRLEVVSPDRLAIHPSED